MRSRTFTDSGLYIEAAFQAVVLQTSALQRVDVSALSHKSRQVFFINVHNALCLQARALCGVPRSMLERKRISVSGALVLSVF